MSLGTALRSVIDFAAPPHKTFALPNSLGPEEHRRITVKVDGLVFDRSRPSTGSRLPPGSAHVASKPTHHPNTETIDGSTRLDQKESEIDACRERMVTNVSHSCDPRYECFHFQTADELLRAIAPVPSLKTDTSSPDFVFRGHRCASWPLIPSAFRPDRQQPTKSEAVTHISNYSLTGTYEDQVFAEFHLLRGFIDICDRAVIALPGDSYEFRQAWLNDQAGDVQTAYRDPTRWPWPQHLPLLAFAQHHGVPTRLLDWTRSATVAAYFAAAGHVNRNEQEDLAVWALNLEMIHIYPQIEVVPMPGANSQRLGAQRGLFTLARFDSPRGVLVDLEHMTLVDALVSPNEHAGRPKPLWKLTLPHTEALRLVYLCHLNGVDAAAVYPDAAGVAIATIERAAWQRSDPATGESVVSSRALGQTPLASQRTP